MSEKSKTRASSVAWVSVAIALGGLVLGARGQWTDFNRLGVDDAVELARTLQSIENSVEEIKRRCQGC